LSISFSILNACKIFAISYWTKGSRSSNPAAWKRASIRAALQFYSRVSIDESLRRRERKAYHSFRYKPPRALRNKPMVRDGKRCWCNVKNEKDAYQMKHSCRSGPKA
jgi:hypothetical protein